MPNWPGTPVSGDTAPPGDYQAVSNPDRSTWDKRADGSTKGMGWLGLLKRPDGNVSSEISVGVDMGGKEQEIPLMVPGLTKPEIDYLMTNEPNQEKNPGFLKNMPSSIMAKAQAFANQRMQQGLSPFRQDGEEAPASAPSTGSEGFPGQEVPLDASVTDTGEGPYDPTGMSVNQIAEIESAGFRLNPGSGMYEKPAISEAPDPQDDSAVNGFVGGLLKPLDNAARGLRQIPGVAAASDAIADLTGLPHDQDVLDANDKARAGNSRTGWQLAGDMVGTLPTVALPGGALAQGAAAGALSTDARDPVGVLADTALGGIAGHFGGKLLDKIANRAPSAAAQALGSAANYGIDLPLGATGRGAAIVEKGLDNLPVSAGIMQEGRDALIGQVGDAVEKVAGSYGPTTSFAGIGDAAQTGAKKWIDKFQTVAGKAYDAIPINPNAPADLSSTGATLKALTGKFSSNPKLAASMKNTRLASYMDALGDKSSKLSWEDLKDFRSRIGEEIGDHLFSDGTMKSELRQLYGALSDDMKATASVQGPGALKAFQRANNLYQQGQARIDGALTKLLGNDSAKTAESSAAKIQAIARDGKSTADLATLAEIRKSLPAEDWAQVQNGVIRLLGQPVNNAGREFSPQTFIQTFKDMAPEARNLFFGSGALRKNLDEFSGVIANLAKNNALRNTSGTTPALNGTAAVAATVAAMMNPILGAKLAVGAAANYSLAKLWTRPAFVKWATGYARMAKGAALAGGQPNVAKQVSLLRKIATSEPAIAQDALGLGEAISRAANDNFSRAAASREEQKDQ